MHYRSLPFTLRQLQYVVAVADARSFRRAAELCFVSQPALSSQVAEVESALGVKLFERDRRRVLVTAAGKELAERGRQLLLGAGALTEAARRFVNPLEGVLRVGVIPTIGPYLVPLLDPALRASYPSLSLRWLEEKTEVLVQRVQEGELDLALLALETDIGGLDHDTVLVDPFLLAAPPGDPLAGGDGPVPPGVLNERDVLLLDEGHCFRDQALDLCSTVGAREMGFRATSLATLVQMVAGGTGITLLPEIAVGLENRHDLLVTRPFESPPPRRTIAFAWRPQSPFAEAFHALTRVAREAVATHRGAV